MCQHISGSTNVFDMTEFDIALLIVHIKNLICSYLFVWSDSVLIICGVFLLLAISKLYYTYTNKRFMYINEHL